jgi:anti-anti-sigma factor
MSLKINVIKKKDYMYIVELRGPLDSDTHQALEDELGEVINENTKAVVLDMAGVDYISSIGIGLVMKTKKALESKMATFAMTNLQPQIKKVFDAMKILPIIDIFDDMPEADKYIDQIIKEEIEKKT